MCVKCYMMCKTFLTGPIDFTRDVITYLLVVGTVIAVAFDGSVRYDYQQ